MLLGVFSIHRFNFLQFAYLSKQKDYLVTCIQSTVVRKKAGKKFNVIKFNRIELLQPWNWFFCTTRHAMNQGRSQEGLDPLQKNLSRALAAVQFFSEGVQTLLATPLLWMRMFQFYCKKSVDRTNLFIC